MKLEFLLRIPEKYLDIKFHRSSFQWEPIFPCGRTEGQINTHNPASRRFLQFANAPKNDFLLYEIKVAVW